MIKKTFFLSALIISYASFLSAIQFHQSEIKLVKSTPYEIYNVFEGRKEEFLEFIGPAFKDFSNDETFMLFCAMFAHHMAPYGKYTGKDASLQSLLGSPYLNCGQYGILAIRMAEVSRPGIHKAVPVHIVAWGAGAFGKHQMQFLTRKNGEQVLVDPTAALIARTNFDAVASGKPLPSSSIITFPHQNYLHNFQSNVRNVILLGRARPGDLQCYFGSMERYLSDKTPRHRWCTPAVQRGLVYPLPLEDEAYQKENELY